MSCSNKVMHNFFLFFQVLRKSQETRPRVPVQIPLVSPIPPPQVTLPQRVITSGTRKDCIRLRGLPYEARVEQILDFLGNHSKNIIFQGVHMVYKAHVSFQKLERRQDVIKKKKQ